MKNKISKGKEITELVKGSLEYTLEWINSQFRKQFPCGEYGPNYWVADSFADYVAVGSYSDNSGLMPNEYFKTTYVKSGDEYTFAPRDQWEVVELGYQPKRSITERKQNGGTRFEEAIEPGQIELLEAKDEKKGTRRIRINELVVANVVNGNKRLYEPEIVEAMIADWQSHLHESAGQGRLKVLTGEADHPTDKGKKRTEYLETVVRWDKLDWDGKRLDIEGDLILTSKGRDVEILMEAGVRPGGSIRGMGESKLEKVNGQKVEKVLWLSMNGVDLVGDPSFKNTAELQESKSSMEDEMTLEQLLQLMRDNPEEFAGITESQLKKMGVEQLKALEEQVRAALGIGSGENITESLKALKEKAGKFDEGQKRGEVETAITEATKDLPFGDKLNKQFVESLKASGAKTGDEVKVIAEGKRKEYGAIAAELKLSNMGFKHGTGLTVLGDVLENETGTPEFARASFEIAESFRRRNGLGRPNLKEPVTPNETYTKMILERFDKLYMRYTDDRFQTERGLLLESKRFEEAELSTDLNLPTSVSRAIFEIVGPTLVAASIFDVGVIDQSPSRLNFKRFSGETGYTGTATAEVVTGGAEGVWYRLAHGRVTPDSITVTSNPAGTTYVEGTDYVIDYAAGRIKFLVAGSIGANDVLATYGYTDIRKGEMAPIERAKITIDSMIITAAADRLADQISREAIVFGRSQLGFDAVTETLAALVQETKRIVDQGLLYAAFSAVKAVAGNATTAWTIGTTQDSLDTLVRLMGAAGIIIDNRYYPCDFYLASNVNAERLSHWDGYKRDGFSNAILNAAGFAGSVNNKPIFSSTEFPDSLIIAGNRQLVMHRVYQPMLIKGPYPTYDVSGSTSKLLAADQYYTEEFNVTESPINEKGAFVPVTA